MIKQILWELFSFIKASILASFIYIIFGRIINSTVVHGVSAAAFMIYGGWCMFDNVDVRFGVFINYLFVYMPAYISYILISSWAYNILPAELFNYVFYPIRTLEIVPDINTVGSMVYMHAIHISVAFIVIFVGWIVKNSLMAKAIEAEEEFSVSEEMVEFLNNKNNER